MQPRTLAILTTLITAALAYAQPVQPAVRAAGFESSLGLANNVIRHGHWFPVVVDIGVPGSGARQVDVELHARDIDGDRVRYILDDVALTGGQVTTVWLYGCVPSTQDRARNPLEIVVRDETTGGDPIRLPLPTLEWIEHDALLVLDISAPQVGGLETVASEIPALQGAAWGERRYYNGVCVARLDRRDLPDEWIGLETVDVIVWDEPVPLENLGQASALRQWVLNGGTLIIGVGASAQALAQTELADLLPAQINTPLLSVDYLPEFGRRFRAIAEERFESPITLARLQAKDGASVLFRDRAPGGEVLDLVVEGNAGFGEIVLCAGSLRALFGERPSRRFAELLLDLNSNTASFNRAESEAGWSMLQQRVSLYNLLRQPIEFQRQASLLIFGALVFVGGYILIATFVAWVWLGRQKARQHSWTAFTVVALLASVLSLGAVGLTRGISNAVHSVAFVDLDADSSDAAARAWLGFKSAQRVRAQLSLPDPAPQDGALAGDFGVNFLRSIPAGPERPTTFATPDVYVALPRLGVLDDVLVRATLKQLEGFWRGNVDGTISANLTVSRETGQLTPDSSITNNLPQRVVGGALLFIDPRLEDFDGGVPRRIWGADRRLGRTPPGVFDTLPIPPAVNVLALPLPEIPSNTRVTRIGEQLYSEWQAEYSRWRGRAEPDPKREPLLPNLWGQQNTDWAPRLTGLAVGGAAATDAAALLASTRRMYLHNTAGSFSRDNIFDSIGRALSVNGLADVDICHWLRGGVNQGQAVLLLIVDGPAPIDLLVDGKPLAASRGRSYYRVRVPINYQGRPRDENAQELP